MIVDVVTDDITPWRRRRRRRWWWWWWWRRGNSSSSIEAQQCVILINCSGGSGVYIWGRGAVGWP